MYIFNKHVLTLWMQFIVCHLFGTLYAFITFEDMFLLITCTTISVTCLNLQMRYIILNFVKK